MHGHRAGPKLSVAAMDSSNTEKFTNILVFDTHLMVVRDSRDRRRYPSVPPPADPDVRISRIRFLSVTRL